MARYLVVWGAVGDWSVHAARGQAAAAVVRSDAEARRIAAGLSGESTPAPDSDEGGGVTTGTLDHERVDGPARLADAARRMKGIGVGALPFCGDDDRLGGMFADRDVAVRCIVEGPPTMIHRRRRCRFRDGEKHEVRRLPVIDGHDLVGIVGLAVLTGNLEDDHLHLGHQPDFAHRRPDALWRPPCLNPTTTSRPTKPLPASLRGGLRRVRSQS